MPMMPVKEMVLFCHAIKHLYELYKLIYPMQVEKAK